MSFSQETLPNIHASMMLRKLIDDGHFTVDWLISNRPKRPYATIFFFLAFLSLVPIVGVLARLLIMFFALQIILGFERPILPQRILSREFSSRHLKRLPQFAFSALTRIEKSVHPRWSHILDARRLSATIVLLISLASLLVPLPLADVPAAAITALMAIAYLEQDGLLLAVAEAMGSTMLALILAAVWFY